jgi:hypothetical protein
MQPPFDPERDTPSSYRKAIRSFGGDNPYGGPMWRVVIAENCLTRAYGTIREMPLGEGGVDDKGHWEADEFIVSAQMSVTPVSYTTGWQWIPKYPVVGWIIEKWFPSGSWGTPEQWASEKNEEGERLHGEYPHRGDYYILGESFPERPPISDVETAIQMYLRSEAEKPTDFERAMKRALAVEKDRIEKKREKYEAKLRQFHKSEILSVLVSTSLAAQGVRNDLQDSLGRRSHLGANEGFTI